MRSKSALQSTWIDDAVLAPAAVVQQLAPAEHVDGVERIRVRDPNGRVGWVTPDARPKGGKIYFEKVDAEDFPSWRVVAEGVRMRKEAALSSPEIPGGRPNLPISGLVRQIAPVQRVDGVERVKIRDFTGKEGWVTPDARPKGGQVYLEKLGSGAAAEEADVSVASVSASPEPRRSPLAESPIVEAD